MTATSQLRHSGILPGPRLDPDRLDAPRSTRFDDTYFDQDDGLAESRHVFLDGCGLPEAWAIKDHYVIGETGFGTGLNFLATWELWHRTAATTARLHYVSIEGFPLEASDIETWHRQWPEVASLSASLIASYPYRQRGYHRLFFEDNRVTLTLIFDDVVSALGTLETSMDAWFLDGFAPSKNPEMWQPDVLNEVARLSHPGTRLATFTVAGEVRRTLEAAGFALEKRPGFGKKREVLMGTYKDNAASIYPEPYFAQSSAITKPNPRVAIIGSGLAGANAAYAFARRGCSVTIFEEQDTVGSGASSVPAGIMMPRLTAADSIDGSYFAAAWPFALSQMRFVEQEHGDHLFNACGVLQLAMESDENGRLKKIVQSGLMAEHSAQYLSPNDATDFAGVPLTQGGLLFPEGGWVKAFQLCRTLTAGVKVITKTSVRRIEHDRAGWTLFDAEGQTLGTSDIVVMASGMRANAFTQTSHLPLTARLGQITFLQSNRTSDALRCVLAGNGHITPTIEGSHSVGATFDHVSSTNIENIREAERDNADERNVSKANTLLDGAFNQSDAAEGKSWVGVRCTTPDHLPIAGPAPDHPFYLESYSDLHHGRRWLTYPTAQYHPGLFVLTGLGSRGLVTAPLAAELIACQALGEPTPLPRHIVDALHPGRFIVRTLKKQKP